MIAGMKVKDVPTSQLRRILRATERAVGTDSTEARIIRRELVRRRRAQRRKLVRHA